MKPTTPDGRYLVVKERLWRCSNLKLGEDERQRLVGQLMNGRRAVKAAKASVYPDEMKAARASVQAATVSLGERGPVWWDDGAQDLNRHPVENACTTALAGCSVASAVRDSDGAANRSLT